MKQVFLNFKNGDIKLLDIPVPALKPGGVLVANYFSLISSGTERQIINLSKKSLIEKAKERPEQVSQFINKIKTDGIFSAINSAKAKLEDNLALGYSSCGKVIEVSADVSEFKVGDLVACAGQNYASHAQVISVPKNLCVKIPENLSEKSSSFATLGAIALQGIRRAKLTVGEAVAVIGLGLIGEITLQILKAYGFPVIGIDLSERNIELAKNFGLDLGLVLGKDDIQDACNKFTNGRGVDACIITASTESNGPIDLSGKILRENGRVSAVGDVNLLIPRKPYYEKELDFFISRSYGPGRYNKDYEQNGIDFPFSYVRWTEKRNMEEFLRLCAKGLINPEKLVTNIFEIEKYKEAYDLILGVRDSQAVLFSYDQNDVEIKRTLVLEDKKDFTAQKGIINIGLIGTGNFAKTTILPILKKINGIKLRAVASADGKDAKQIAENFQSDYATTDFQEILNDKEIDLVFVVTRHNLHAKIAVDGLLKNKNIHIEKPLALNEKELGEVIGVAKKSSGRLMVGFNRRFSPAAESAKKFFGNNSGPYFLQMRINAGFLPRDHWTRDPVEGGGRIIGEACHFVDLCQYLTGSAIKKIYAMPLPQEKASEDDILINLSMEDGSKAAIIYTTQAPASLSKEYIEITGGNKAVIIDNFKSWTFYSGMKKKKNKLFFSQDKGHKKEFQVFIDSVKNGKPSPIALDEIENSMLATFKILESLRDQLPKEVVK